ncbi:hypothetical protein D3C73_1422480 [compost metagenome]
MKEGKSSEYSGLRQTEKQKTQKPDYEPDNAPRRHLFCLDGLLPDLVDLPHLADDEC